MIFSDYLNNRVKGRENNLPIFFYDKERTYDYCINNQINTVKKIALLNSIDELEGVFDSLPENFVIKPSFLSSMIGVLVLEKQKDGLYYEGLTKRKYSKEEIIASQKNHFENSKRKDKHIVIEQKINDKYIYGIPFDYKVYIFYDEIALISVLNRNSNKLFVDWYDGNFDAIDDNRIINNQPYVFNSETKIKISCEDKKSIINFAKSTSKKIKLPFVSLDLYLTETGPILGEV